ncbi:uncharacterized protein N7473_011937 [Penicillium subrubescens]|uniref:Uncharacterized protein n=1 Tax=Penicillium subrubescens TaxID=1316194 RepID=A0A1Q5UPD6_9EURO|nr:uncharacterized protein N7473_011937 [Penicillium subrubescens]KAJ5880884.1 hypothetical protein N7473_011937 [Penicillium subrubescens]OKP14347.1 hypothetical protein PENSUB_14126 [Penicillium subrubescens]
MPFAKGTNASSTPPRRMMFLKEHPDSGQRVMPSKPKRFTGDPCWQTLSYGVLLVPETHAYLKNFDTVVRTPSVPALALKNRPKASPYSIDTGYPHRHEQANQKNTSGPPEETLALVL